MFDQGSAPGPLLDAAGAGGGDVPAPSAAPPGAAVPGAESPDAPALAERLASLAPGADLAALVEGLMGGLLGPAAPAALREEAQGEPVLLDEGLLAPADLSLLRRAQTREIGAAGALAADALGQMGAEVLSEVVAACRRLATWSQWALGVASACLARSPEMRTGPAPREPGGRAERFVTPEETRFHASSEIACRLGVARTSAERLLDRGEGLLDGVFAPTECLHRCGLLDEAKTALVLSRLKGVAYEAAREVQERVLPRAPQRTRPQLARDIDRALAALDPQGAGARRRRNVTQRHVGRPSPRGEGVARMSLLLPTADAFLLDATLDAVAASARASGQERTLGQLRADALVGLCLHALRSSQHAAHRLGPGRAGEAVDPAADGVPAPAGGDGPADPPGPARPAGGAARGAAPDAERPRLLPDGVPLEGLLSSLSDLVGSSSPWWTPSGTGPVPLPPGLTVRVDVTVPLDQLLPDAAAPPPRAPGARPPSRGGPPDAPVLTAGAAAPPCPPCSPAPWPPAGPGGGSSPTRSPAPCSTSAAPATARPPPWPTSCAPGTAPAPTPGARSPRAAATSTICGPGPGAAPPAWTTSPSCARPTTASSTRPGGRSRGWTTAPSSGAPPRGPATAARPTAPSSACPGGSGRAPSWTPAAPSRRTWPRPSPAPSWSAWSADWRRPPRGRGRGRGRRAWRPAGPAPAGAPAPSRLSPTPPPSTSWA